eukprot:RCo026748
MDFSCSPSLASASPPMSSTAERLTPGRRSDFDGDTEGELLRKEEVGAPAEVRGRLAPPCGQATGSPPFPTGDDAAEGRHPADWQLPREGLGPPGPIEEGSILLLGSSHSLTTAARPPLSHIRRTKMMHGTYMRKND